MRKIRTLSFAALALAGLSLLGSRAQAGLINQDTGEGYWPSLDEDGEVEEAPDWVPEVENETTVFVSEVVLDQDYCESAVDEWLGNGDHDSVLTGMGDTNTRNDLFDAIESWIVAEIADEVSGLPSGVSVGTANLTSLGCPSSTYTYMDCLQDGLDWEFCKRTYPKQAIDPHSALTVSIPAFGPLGVDGTITVHGGLRYRESTRSFGGVVRRGCFMLGDISVSGFSGLQNMVIGQVEQLFDNGELCLSPP